MTKTSVWFWMPIGTGVLRNSWIWKYV